MTRRVFFLHHREVGKETEVVLSREVSHHITRVLRLREGDHIELRDESGQSWKARISKIEKKGVRVSLIEKVFLNAEPPVSILLFLALARPDRVDLAVRQATELGARKIVLFSSSRSPYRIEKSRISDRVLRWEKIAREAVCQCGRRFPPEICYIHDFRDILMLLDEEVKNGPESLKIVAAEDAHENLYSVIENEKKPEKVAIAIGPEGGWTTSEISAFESSKWRLVSFGPRILRYETAVVVALALCQFLWGDMG